MVKAFCIILILPLVRSNYMALVRGKVMQMTKREPKKSEFLIVKYYTIL